MFLILNLFSLICAVNDRTFSTQKIDQDGNMDVVDPSPKGMDIASLSPKGMGAKWDMISAYNKNFTIIPGTTKDFYDYQPAINYLCHLLHERPYVFVWIHPDSFLCASQSNLPVEILVAGLDSKGKLIRNEASSCLSLSDCFEYACERFSQVDSGILLTGRCC